MKTSNLKFWLVVGLQIIILLALWGFNHLQFVAGERILLKLSPPRDPLSLLQGHYLRLDYEISEIMTDQLSGDCSQDFDASQIKRGGKVYVYLAEQGNYWQAKAVCPNKSNQPGITSLKGELTSSYGSRIRLKYGIENYFIPEKNWQEIERAFQQARADQDIFVEVTVSRFFGNALIRDIYIGDQKIDIRAISEGG